MGYFKTLQYGGGGGIMAPWPLVTLAFLKVEGQKFLTWGILMCFLKNGTSFQIQGFYDVIMTS